MAINYMAANYQNYEKQSTYVWATDRIYLRFQSPWSLTIGSYDSGSTVVAVGSRYSVVGGMQ